MKRVYVTASLACMDYLHVAADLDALQRGGVDLFHIDVMDGNYVPNYCLNWDIVQQVRAYSSKPMDVHLMVTNVERDLVKAVELGCEAVCFHVEAPVDTHRLIDYLHSAGRKAGLAIRPTTQVEALFPFLGKLDYVLMLGVEPGFYGQQFKRDTLGRIAALDAYRREHALDFLIEVDGGVSFENVKEIVQSGADVIVAGTLAIFGQPEPLETLTQRFKEHINK